jgi:tight adherence protein B
MGSVTGTGILAAVFGAVVGLGLTLIVSGLTPTTDGPSGSGPAGLGWRARLETWRDRQVPVRLAAAIAAGLAAGVFTRWLVAAALAGLGVWALPRLLATDPDAKAKVGKIEAIAAWTEMLRDTLSAAAGLEQAITATAPIAPEAIREQVTGLAARTARGQRLGPALRDFADDLADPTADLVVAALILAAEHQARDLSGLLAGLATTAREQVGMRLRVAAGRARTVTSVRTIVAVTLAMAVGLVLLDRAWLDSYDTPTGQLVLLLVGGVFAGALAWLARLGRLTEPARVLTRLDTLTPSQAGTAGETPDGGQGWRA